MIEDKPKPHKDLLIRWGLAYPDDHLANIEAAISSKDYIFKNIEAQDNGYGKCVVAREEIKKGERVARFRGEIKTFRQYPFAEKPYLLPLGDSLWLNPVGIPRFINHSCKANCELRNRIDIVAIQDIAPGEELSFRYDLVAMDKGEDSVSFFEEARWDHAFTFVCLCGSDGCVGVVDKNRYFEKVPGSDHKPAVKPREVKREPVKTQPAAAAKSRKTSAKKISAFNQRKQKRA